MTHASDRMTRALQAAVDLAASPEWLETLQPDAASKGSKRA
jgi:hypothetical protein